MNKNQPINQDGKKLFPEKIQINWTCQGPCGETGKTLYKVIVKDVETGKESTKNYCTDCYDEAKAEKDIYDLEEIRKENINLNREMSNVPKIFKDMTMDHFITDPLVLHKHYTDREMRMIAGVKDFMQKFLDVVLAGDGAMVALIGDYGTGKSLLASICINEITKAGKIGRLEYASILSKKMMQNDMYELILKAALENDLFVIDEINSAHETAFTERALSEVINAFYAAGKSIIVMFNGTGGDLKKYIGEKGYDRIQDSPNGGIVRCKWPTFRGTEIRSK